MRVGLLSECAFVPWCVSSPRRRSRHRRRRPSHSPLTTLLKARTFPAQVIWGAEDPALKMSRYAPEMCEVLGLKSWHQVRGKHFLQEDSPIEIAQKVASLVADQTV